MVLVCFCVFLFPLLWPENSRNRHVVPSRNDGDQFVKHTLVLEVVDYFAHNLFVFNFPTN